MLSDWSSLSLSTIFKAVGSDLVSDLTDVTCLSEIITDACEICWETLDVSMVTAVVVLRPLDCVVPNDVCRTGGDSPDVWGCRMGVKVLGGEFVFPW